MLDFLALPGLDNLRNWLATIGGVVAVVIGLRTYRRNVRTRREEQARLVYAKIVYVADIQAADHIRFNTQGSSSGITKASYTQVKNSLGGTEFIADEPILQVVVAVHNGSKELIGPAKVQVVNRGAGTTYDVSFIMGSADPEGETLVEFTMTNDRAPGLPPLGATVIFRDASGAWWRRHLAEPIEAVHDDPENWTRGPKEREESRANQAGLGMVPDEEPKVGFKVRWHRFWRKCRGKSAVP